MKNNKLYPELTKEISEKRTALAPEMAAAFKDFSKAVFKDGALQGWKVRHIMAIGKAEEHSYTAPARIENGGLNYEMELK